MLFALLYISAVAYSYFNLKSALHDAASELLAKSVLKQQAPEIKPSYEPTDVQHEMAFARNTIERMSLPWEALFKALDDARTREVSLLSVDPHTDTNTVQISAQATDLPAMLTYLSHLQDSRVFQNVSLAHHEISKDRPRQPVLFTIVATWKPLA